MAIFGTNIADDVLLPLFISLLFLPYVSGQSGDANPYYKNENEPRVPLFVAGMVMFSLIFSMLACCLCCKFCVSPPAAADDVETGEWPRRTGRRGLDAEVIESFPSFVYSEVKGLKIGKGGVQCAVCLNEFEDRESLRLMPPCSHVFHVECIDAWLSSRSTCPVCRADLHPKPGESLPYPIVASDTGRRALDESPEVRLMDSVTWMERNRPPRSLSTGLSSWRIAEILVPRSHSTGHSLVQLGENVDRFTLQLPEEVLRQLALPQARSSRRGYRSGSVGSERSVARQNKRRTFSLSLSFSSRAPKGSFKVDEITIPQDIPT